MNLLYKRFCIITLFFSLFLNLSIYSEWSSNSHFTFPGFAFVREVDNKTTVYDKNSGSDFSYNEALHTSKDHHHWISKNKVKLYTAQDFQHYFAQHGYTQTEILNQRCLYMLDEFVQYAQTCTGYEEAIRNLYTELKKLNLAQKFYHLTNGQYCRKLQKRINFLYNSLPIIKTNQSCTSDVYSPYLNLLAQQLPILTEQFAEYKTLKSIYDSYTPFLSHAIAKRWQGYQALSNSHFVCTNKSYNLNHHSQQLLLKYGYDTSCFTQCTGNELQHIIHQESIDILDRIDGLALHSILYDHQEALVDLNAAVVDYNHAGLPDKAMCVADLCWTILDCGQAVMEGAALGLYSAAYDILTNPIEATVSIVAGKQVLTFQLCKVLYDVADIGVTALSDIKSAQKKWDKYTESLNNIIDAINKKEITVRDAIKGGTAFVVGYKAQGKLLGGLGKFCNTIKQKSINFVKNNPLFSPQEYVTTPEGLLFKATSKGTKIKISGQTNDGSHLKSCIDNKVSKLESLYPVNASGKGILCKGDLREKIERYKEHIFSPEHQRDGILTLGKDKATIMDSLHNVILSLDEKGLLKEGANQIKAAINGVNNVEIRCFIQNGEALSVNAFLSRFNRIYGNFIDVMKV